MDMGLAYDYEFSEKGEFKVIGRDYDGMIIYRGEYRIDGLKIILTYQDCNPTKQLEAYCLERCSYIKNPELFRFYDAGLRCSPESRLNADPSTAVETGEPFVLDGYQAIRIPDSSLKVPEPAPFFLGLVSDAEYQKYECRSNECPPGKSTVDYLPTGTPVFAKAISAEKHTIQGITDNWVYIIVQSAPDTTMGCWIPLSKIQLPQE